MPGQDIVMSVPKTKLHREVVDFADIVYSTSPLPKDPALYTCTVEIENKVFLVDVIHGYIVRLSTIEDDAYGIWRDPRRLGIWHLENGDLPLI